MDEEKTLKLGLIQAIIFLLYIIGVFGISLMAWEYPLTYFITGILMIALIIISGVYIIFYFMRKKK